MKPTSKYATKLPDTKTQMCLQWARTAGEFSTLEMAMTVLDCGQIGDKAHKKAGRVMSNYRHLFQEIHRSRGGSTWRMLDRWVIREGVIHPAGDSVGWLVWNQGGLLRFLSFREALLSTQTVKA